MLKLTDPPVVALDVIGLIVRLASAAALTCGADNSGTTAMAAMGRRRRYFERECFIGFYYIRYIGT